MTPNGQIPAAPAEVPAYSRFGQRIRRRYPTEMHLLAPGLPDRTSIGALCERLCAGGTDLGVALRITRQLVLERLLCLDCRGEATMQQVTGTMTALAEYALDAACMRAQEGLDALHGAPRTESGERARIWVVGM